MSNEPASSAGVARTTGTDRITVALIAKAAGDLARLQGRTGLGKTDAINRSISLYEFVTAQLAAGNELVLRSPDGAESRVILL